MFKKKRQKKIPPSITNHEKEREYDRGPMVTGDRSV